MSTTPHTAPRTDGAHATEERLTALEIKASYAEDLLDTLNQLVASQQEHIDLLLREMGRLRQRSEPDGVSAARNPRDELPPHY